MSSGSKQYLGASRPLDEKLGFKSIKRSRSPLEKTDEISPKPELGDANKSMLSEHIIIDKSKKYGEGSYGVVYKATNKYTAKEYAAKIIDKRSLNKSMLESIARESSITSGLDHPNIIKTHFVNENESTVTIFMDLISGGELYEHVNQYEHLSECRAYFLFKQMVDAIEYLHQNYIAHHDIKLENMLINNENDLHVYIIDFGFSFIRMPGDALSDNFKGTPAYASPELLLGRPNSGFPSDIWALGVCLYIMAVGNYPFFASNLYVLRMQVTRGKYDDSSIPDEQLKDLIGKMLTVKEEDRITIQEIKSHPWMEKWEKYIDDNTNCSKMPNKIKNDW
jgi:serine/threonine protein kinase